MQLVRVLKNSHGNVLTSVKRVLRQWKEYFEELMNGENERERERKLDEAEIVNQEVQQISAEKDRAVMNRMKTGKAVGPNDIPVEAWRCLGELVIDFLTRLLNKILEDKRMPDEWRSAVVPIFKNKGDV